MTRTRALLVALGWWVALGGTAVPVVGADPPAPAPASAPDQCAATLALARQYSGLLKERADHYELAVAELRARVAGLESQVKDLTAKLKAAEQSPAPEKKPTE